MKGTWEKRIEEISFIGTTKNRKEILLPWKIEFKKWKDILPLPKIVFDKKNCQKLAQFSFWFSHKYDFEFFQEWIPIVLFIASAGD